MKSISFLLFIQFIFIFSSCQKQEKSLSSISPDGLMSINILAAKESIASPWMLKIQVKKNNKVSEIETEFYADAPNNENIIFNWTENNLCNIILMERDGTTRTVPVIIK